MKLKSIVSSTLLVVISLTLASPVEAVSTNANQAAQARAAERNARAIARCETLEAKFQLKKTRFEKNKQGHVLAYNNAKERVERFIAKAKDKGYDTAKLEADFAIFETKIADFNTAYTEYITLLQAAKEYTCGEPEGDFRAKLEQTRAQLRIVRQKSLEVRNYYQTTIRPDIAALKEQKTSSASNETEENDDSTTADEAADSTADQN
jgi:hypothetical protein